ncbi:hypothetical protein C8R44DRAFT_725225 [Mycena epipterygia]|nr:hypothetical protein C8R44DRAFT_725225 [Mycena epipterygia]
MEVVGDGGSSSWMFPLRSSTSDIMAEVVKIATEVGIEDSEVETDWVMLKSLKSATGRGGVGEDSAEALLPVDPYHGPQVPPSTRVPLNEIIQFTSGCSHSSFEYLGAKTTFPCFSYHLWI